MRAFEPYFLTARRSNFFLSESVFSLAIAKEFLLTVLVKSIEFPLRTLRIRQDYFINIFIEYL
jgi:hypothetical protein